MSNDAVRILYENHASELDAFARQRVGATDSRDVVHDAYLRLMNYADEATLENPRAYLYRVTANAANDHASKIKARAELIEADVEPDTQHSLTPGGSSYCKKHPATLFGRPDRIARNIPPRFPAAPGRRHGPK